MKNLAFIFIILVTTFVSCDNNYIEWDLPRRNNIDTLKNENPINSQWPIAKFSASNTSVPIGSSISFLSTSTQNPSTYNWSFQGATPTTSTEISPTVLYNSMGKFNVNLKVANSYGSDSLMKPSYIEVYYLKSFNNGLLDSWISNGWNFSSHTSGDQSGLYAWGGTSGGGTATISNTLTNITPNAKLYFNYYVYSPSGTLNVYVNGVKLWNKSGYGSATAEVQLPSITTFTLNFEAVLGETQSIYLNNIMIRP